MTEKLTTTAEAPASGASAPGERLRLHLGIAEQGKLYALEGDHPRALFYYRWAMQMAVAAGDPEVFFRHYLECVVESLERMSAFAEVVDYCEKAIELHRKNPEPDPVALRDLAHLHQRLGIVRLKGGDRDGARESLRAALAVLAGSGQALPLAASLLRWVELGLHLDRSRIEAELEKARYFSVREEAVDRECAIRLPEAVLPPALRLQQGWQ
jgi:tetratricopeptide (TPR) repeat protein